MFDENPSPLEEQENETINPKMALNDQDKERYEKMNDANA
jgi:hypothetical protein